MSQGFYNQISVKVYRSHTFSSMQDLRKQPSRLAFSRRGLLGVWVFLALSGLCSSSTLLCSNLRLEMEHVMPSLVGIASLFCNPPFLVYRILLLVNGLSFFLRTKIYEKKGC